MSRSVSNFWFFGRPAVKLNWSLMRQTIFVCWTVLRLDHFAPAIPISFLCTDSYASEDLTKSENCSSMNLSTRSFISGPDRVNSSNCVLTNSTKAFWINRWANRTIKQQTHLLIFWNIVHWTIFCQFVSTHVRTRPFLWLQALQTFHWALESLMLWIG